MQTCDIAIIGCGPAGLSAAIQLKRLGEEPLVFEASRVGGLLVNAHLVENYPGFPEGLSGRLNGTCSGTFLKCSLKRLSGST